MAMALTNDATNVQPSPRYSPLRYIVIGKKKGMYRLPTGGPPDKGMPAVC